MREHSSADAAAYLLELLDGQGSPSARAWLETIWTRVVAADLALHDLPASLSRAHPRLRRWRLLRLSDAAIAAPPCGETRRLRGPAPLPELLLLTLDDDDARFPSLAIVGTGPLSIAGGGLAVRVRRPAVLDRLRGLFQETWNASDPAARIGPGRTVAVRESAAHESASGELVYARCLSELLRHGPEPPAPTFFDLTAFQADAVARAIDALRTHGGVVVADSVGLGKTYVALALIERELTDGGRVLVVTPAALRRDWRRALAGLAPLLPEPERAAWLDARPRAERPPPNLELRLEERAAPYEPRLTWTSAERLGRSPPSTDGRRRFTLVVVDEAHQFRNPATRRYRTLAAIARGARTALLTATPVNNSPRDLLHLLELFAGPGDFRDLGVADLHAAFRDDGDDLRLVLEAVVIRRTRPFVAAHYRGVTTVDRDGRRVELRFPRRAPPRPVRYDLARTYGRLYDALEEHLGAIAFAALEPFAARTAAGAVAPILRILLLKRMESSVDALRRSVARQAAFHTEVVRALREGRHLSRAAFRSLFETGEERGEIQLALGVVLPELPSPGRRRALLPAAERDLASLRRLHELLAPIGPHRDAKLHALLDLLRRLHGEKILIFTEFRDTARYLFRRLSRLGAVAQIDGGRAVLSASGPGGERASRRWIIDRFAPVANGARAPAERERVDVLIATDLLSEGLNLQDARHVVSYDLPWNPVRLIQRAGRIDRLGSPHDLVFVHHFVPEAGLERLLGILGTLREKLGAIDRTVGLEHPLLEGEPAVDPARLRPWLERLNAGDPSALDELERAEAEPFEWKERLRREFAEWTHPRPDACARARALGDGIAAAVRSDGLTGSAFYFRAEIHGRPVRHLWLAAESTADTLRADRAQALRLFALARDLPAARPAPDFPAVWVAAREAARRWADACTAALLAHDRVTAATAQGRALRWLQAFARACPPERVRALGAAIDQLYAAFARRQPRGLERDLEPVVEALPDPPDESGLRRLQSFLREHPEWRAGDEPVGPYRLREVAAVNLVAPEG